MIRRSFRIGLRLGLLIGVGFALVKTVQSRRAASRGASPEPWQPIVDTPRPRAAEEEGAIGARPVRRPIDEVAEPVEEPPPANASAPSLRMPEVGVRAQREDMPPDEATVERAGPTRKAAKRATPTPKKTAAKKSSKKSAKKAPARKAAASNAAFVEPVGGVCPPTHEVKAKLSSRLFHLPGMFAYARTRPDRCYASAEAAEADGFVQARR